MNSKVKINLKSIAILFIILISFIPKTAFATPPGSSGGGSANSGGPATWWHAEGIEGTTIAWDNFVKNSKKGNSTYVTERVNKLGGQIVAGGGTFADACKRSQFIWWYGGDNNGYWYENSGVGVGGLDIDKNGDKMGSSAKDWFNDEFLQHKPSRDNFMSDNPDNTPSLICSGTLQEVRNIIVTGNSGTYKYDGKPKTVKGYKVTGDTVKSGDKVEAVAKNTKTAPGVYSVNVSSAKVLVTTGTKYNIKKRSGKFIIWFIPEDEKGPLTQCIDSKSDSATAYTVNSTEGRSVYSPGGSLGGKTVHKNTPAGEHSGVTHNSNFSNTIPPEGSPVNSWYSWKSSFQGGSRDKMSPDISYNALTMSKHGGVFEVNKRLTKDTFNMTHCLRQNRSEYQSRELVTEPDGTQYYEYFTKLTPWKDAGREVESVNRTSSRSISNEGYQILGVNCNESGFNNVVSSIGGEVMTNGKGSGLLITPVRKGKFTGSLGKSGPTATSEFYTDGTSCQEVFNCTSNKLAGASNDSDKNRESNPLFTEELKSGSDNLTNDNNELEFFRDNNDRTVRADVWYPRDTGVNDLFSHPGKPALSSYVNVYRGTPSIDITTIETIKNGSSTPSGPNLGLGISGVNGHTNKLNVKSQWASDENKPYEIGMNWRYRSSWKNTVPQVVNGEKEVKGVYDGKGEFGTYCEFKNKMGAYPANIPKTPHANGSSNSPIWSDSDHLKILFNRSRSDERR